jgi:hypothetical protein
MSNASTSGLENLTVWLWDNAEEGLHITMTTNYNLPTEKRWFFSYSGAQTKNTWRAYDRSQPENLREWFRDQKSKFLEIVSAAQSSGHDVYISKQTRNTGTKGRAVAQGFCATFVPTNHTGYAQFILKMRDATFKGEFDPGLLSESQRRKGCLGVYKWSAVEEVVDSVDPW